MAPYYFDVAPPCSVSLRIIPFVSGAGGIRAQYQRGQGAMNGFTREIYFLKAHGNVAGIEQGLWHGRARLELTYFHDRSYALIANLSPAQSISISVDPSLSLIYTQRKFIGSFSGIWSAVATTGHSLRSPTKPRNKYLAPSYQQFDLSLARKVTVWSRHQRQWPRLDPIQTVFGPMPRSAASQPSVR